MLQAALGQQATIRMCGALPDFELLLDWEGTAEPCWDLAYRSDARNWRNMDLR